MAGKFQKVLLLSEAATRRVLWNKVFLKNSKNSQENACVGVSIKKAEVFFVNFAEFLRTTFLQNTSGRLLLYFLFKTLLAEKKFCANTALY